uniref:Uncharacterized protein n=1 Tax=Arundo donax TaxID=35708 RepID=A0A0A8YMG1_ARUDO
MSFSTPFAVRSSSCWIAAFSTAPMPVVFSDTKKMSCPNCLSISSSGCALLNAIISAREGTGDCDKSDK